MKSLIAALRTLTLPWGAGSGKRILLDGVNGQIIIFDENNVQVVTEDSTGIKTLASGGYILLNPAVPGVPFDTVAIQFGDNGTRDPAQIEGTSFDVDTMALSMRSGIRNNPPTWVTAWSELLLRNNAASLFAQNDGVLNGVLLTATTSTVNKPWQIEGETWHNPVLLNGWSTVGVASFFAPAYTLSADGASVKLSGGMANGTITNGTTVFNVPAAYRPSKRVQLTVSLNAGTALTAVVQVLETGYVGPPAGNPGDVKIYGVPAGNGVLFDGQSYRLI